MRQYTAGKYIELVENIDDPILQSWMKIEMDVIRKVKDPKNKTFIDLGAGYGRVITELAKIARNVVSIEINPGMMGELKKRTKMYQNATAIKGDIQELTKLLEKEDVKNPVLLLVQNTLGTIEGDYQKVLSEMKIVTQKYQGEVIISVLRQEALKDYGVPVLYSKIKEMAGEVDLQKTNFDKGLFVSKTGYRSKWWSSEETNQIKEFFGGQIVNEIFAPQFCVIHIKI